MIRFLKEQNRLGRIRLFIILRLQMSRWLESKHVRPWLLRKAGIKLGPKAHIGANVTFDNWNADCFDIGENVTITMNSVLLTHGMIRQIDGTYKSTVGTLTIGNNVFIGAGTIITKPLKIGNNVVIGAGSVITKDIPDNVVIAGVPARIIVGGVK